MEEQKKNISLSDFFKSLGIPTKKGIRYLIDNKYIYIEYYGKEKTRHKNVSFPKYDTEKGIGYFEMNRRPNSFNKNKSNINIQITPKGQEFFKEKLKGDNYHGDT